MPGEIQTSFIPKAPITAAAKPAERSSVGFMTVISLILVLASVAVFGGALAYKQILTKEISDIKSRIASLRAEMPLANLREIERLHNSLVNADILLTNHVSANRIFTLLQDSTIPAVRYSNFNFSDDQVKVKGTARSYEDVAAQAKVLATMKDKITAFEFSDFTVDKTTNIVSFSLVLTVSPDAFRYVGDLAGSAVLPVLTTGTTSAASTTPNP